MKGDQLASGGKTATFSATDNPKRMTDAEYAERTGAPVPAPRPEPVEDLVSHVDNSALFAKPKPTHYHRFKAYNDTVLVKRIDRESNRSIIIPDSARGKSDTGLVIAAGAGMTDITTGKRTPLEFQAGDTVLFDKFASVGMEITLLDENGDETEYLILKACDILGGLEVVEVPKESVN